MGIELTDRGIRINNGGDTVTVYTDDMSPLERTMAEKLLYPCAMMARRMLIMMYYIHNIDFRIWES